MYDKSPKLLHHSHPPISYLSHSLLYLTQSVLSLILSPNLSFLSFSTPNLSFLSVSPPNLPLSLILFPQFLLSLFLSSPLSPIYLSFSNKFPHSHRALSPFSFFHSLYKNLSFSFSLNFFPFCMLQYLAVGPPNHTGWLDISCFLGIPAAM